MASEYNDFYNKYKKDYNNKFVLLFQCGDFFEIYSNTKSPKENKEIDINNEFLNIDFGIH